MELSSLQVDRHFDGRHAPKLNNFLSQLQLYARLILAGAHHHEEQAGKDQETSLDRVFQH
jgi:hypothetical protein